MEAPLESISNLRVTTTHEGTVGTLAVVSEVAIFRQQNKQALVSGLPTIRLGKTNFKQ